MRQPAIVEGPERLIVDASVASDARYEPVGLDNDAIPSMAPFSAPRGRGHPRWSPPHSSNGSFPLRLDALKARPRGQRLVDGEIGHFTFEDGAIGGREAVGLEPLVGDFDTRRNGHVRPVNVAACEDVDLGRRAFGGIVCGGRAQVRGQIAEAFPTRQAAKPRTTNPSRSFALRGLVVGVEPEAPARAVVDSQSLRWHVELGKGGQNGVEGIGIAATFGVPLAAAIRRPFHQAIRAGVLKIAAAPAGQPGSPIGLLPSPPEIMAGAV